MSGDVEAGSTRPRPLSGGFWTLLSWLRKDEQSSSNESLSSAGSDRTTVSFAFLTPAHYHSKAAPIILPPPGPPTDTYKNRVRERNLRRQYDRDITLHRKYGLIRGEGVVNYDAFSLPPARRSAGAGGERADRDRRAASECFQRRAAHVPGKRRAPPPPRAPPRAAAQDPVGAVTRRHSRKRPAPQPPAKLTPQAKDSRQKPINSILMSNQPSCNVQDVKCNPALIEAEECKPEKYIKKDPKENRVKADKSFLKQIFENKKRNSTIDTSFVKILPSISELDRQAAEIIENNKIKYTEQSNLHRSKNINRWCPKCLQGVCLCATKNMPSSSNQHIHHENLTTICTQTERDLSKTPQLRDNMKEDEKQKLKIMLKEMKDSLPKRHKQEYKSNTQSKNKLSPVLPEKNNMTDTPTLRIGTPSQENIAKPEVNSDVSNEKVLEQKKIEQPNAISVSQNVKQKVVIKEKDKAKCKLPISREDNAMRNIQSDTTLNDGNKLNTPLKISSLLNPIYVPKETSTNQQNSPKKENVVAVPKNGNKNLKQTTQSPDPIYVKTADAVRDIILNSSIPGNSSPSNLQSIKTSPDVGSHDQNSKNISCTPVNTPNRNLNHVERLSDHSRRRELVIQLEQSIAKGDEHAAAEAAAKLAQLRLSCSVLSFSSQILGGPSTSNSNQIKDKVTVAIQTKDANQKNNKVSTETTETLPDLIKEGVSSSKHTKPKGASESVVGDVAKRTTIGSPLANISENKDVREKTPPRASTSKELNNGGDRDLASLKIWIEDKEKARGPIQLHVRRDANVAELRRQAETTLGLPARLQRWIVGRTLCADDNIPLVSLAGSSFNAPFYLCLVESEANANTKNLNDSKKEEKNIKDKKTSDVYTELVNLERQAVVPNTEKFECDICMEECNPGDGVILRECVHSFCKVCLSDVIRHCEEPTVSCPATGCPGELHEREIRALVNADEYQRWLARGLAVAESGTRNAFHCRTKDCTGWALCEREVRRFPCPVCKHTNCVPCQAIHDNETCEQYQAKLLEAKSIISNEKTDEGTQALIDGLISRGEAVQCPECSAVITKKWGCDWVKCSACKTEICWVTRGRRWGPGGRGDTSAGCRCGVDGKRCHPSCGYCH